MAVTRVLTQGPSGPQSWLSSVTEPRASWRDVPQHHHDGALAAREDDQAFPYHECRRHNHGKVQNLVVELEREKPSPK